MSTNTKEIKITAEPQMDPNVCRFYIDRPLYDGVVNCRNAEMAKDSPLLEALFAIDGIDSVLVANATLTVKKNSDSEWSELARQVGVTVREKISAGGELISKEAVSRTPESGDLQAKVQAVINEEINPQIAAHGGSVEVVDVQGTTIFMNMSGGCQGCASASHTLRHGVEEILKSRVPEVTEIVDVTDHSSGTNPYY